MNFCLRWGRKPCGASGRKAYTIIRTFADRYIHWLKLYYYIGGMPEAVNDYAENGDITSVREIQKQILELYEQDFSKHTPDTELARLRMVWNSVPLQLAKENKKFFFGHLKQEPGRKILNLPSSGFWTAG